MPAAIGLVGLAAVAVSTLVPSELVATTENVRLGEQQPAPYARTPASAESVNDRVEYGDLPDDVEVFETTDDFFFVTVSQPEQSVLSWLLGSADPVVDLLTEEGRNGRRTASQNRQLGLQQMRTATQEAQFVALSVAGYEPTIEQGAVVVQDILCRVPADDGFECVEQFAAGDALEPGDTILEIDGVPVATVEELSAELAGKEPGDEVTMLIDRAGSGPMEVSVELSADPTDPDRTIVGFAPFDTRSVELPFDVAIDTQAVGGPSAGLAFTLALIDELTEGDLTPGEDVAVTGTIRLDGSVGPIGGLEQKVDAVRQHGVRTFLVPSEQIEFSELDPERPDDGICRLECLIAAGDGDVELIPVATLDEALEVLESLGGDPLVPVDVG
ncbi:MAG: S16 family serine protease [Ilumatobacter sp.]